MELIYIPCSSEQEAEKIAQQLLEKKLIACANIFPIRSMYWWEGKIAKENEVVLLCKTEKRYEEVKRVVEEMHSYSIPCILKIDSSVNSKYADWIHSSIRNS